MDTRTMQERLQKIIARAGVSSRRAAEEIITSGRVRVNGRVVTELGAKADPRTDKVEVDGKRVTAPAPVYVVLHKPRNVVSTLHDPEGRPSVAELLESVGTRVFPVGRLDFATSGVLLATNDGEFSQGLLHPKKGVPKTYVVKVTGLMEPQDLERWERGVDLEDGRTRPADVHFLRHEEGKTWFEITIQEGRNQQIRRMGEATGFPVMRLARVSFAGVTHEDLRPGQWRFLTPDELMDLRKTYGVPRRVRGAETGPRGQVFGKVRARGEPRHARPRAHDEAPRARAPRPHARDEAPRARAPRPHDEAPRARAPRAHDEAPRARAPRPHDEAPRARAPRSHDEAPRARTPRSHERAEAPRPRAPRPHAKPPR
jgi:23S rRNA pseudouridine2605 synthase